MIICRLAIKVINTIILVIVVEIATPMKESSCATSMTRSFCSLSISLSLFLRTICLFQSSNADDVCSRVRIVMPRRVREREWEGDRKKQWDFHWKYLLTGFSTPVNRKISIITGSQCDGMSWQSCWEIKEMMMMSKKTQFTLQSENHCFVCSKIN